MKRAIGVLVALVMWVAAGAQVRTARPEGGAVRPDEAQGPVKKDAAGRLSFDPFRDLAPPPATGVQALPEGEFLPFTEYKLGPEDLITVTVLDSPEFSRPVRVSGSGAIRLPLMQKPIAAAGKTSAELEKGIAAALVEEGLLRDPAVSVTLREFHSKPVTISGAVRSPVVFQATRPLTLVEAIARAGGLTDTAGQEILISTPEAEGSPSRVLRVSVKTLQDLSDPRANVMLQGGEQVRVPAAGKVYIIGGVLRPGPVLISEDQPLTVLHALAQAGGTAPTASSRATLLRGEAGAAQKQEIALDLKKVMKQKQPDMILQSNDVLYIPDSQSKRLTQMGVAGAMSAFLYSAAGVLLWR